jgi:fimbrial isopeptide formation D2 family protein
MVMAPQQSSPRPSVPSGSSADVVEPARRPRSAARRAPRGLVGRSAVRRLVAATLALVLSGLTAGAAATAAAADDVPPALEVTSFLVTGIGVTGAARQPDATYASDLGYAVSPATNALAFALSYRCPSETTGSCVDSTLVLDLGAVGLTAAGLSVAGATVTYRDAADASTSDPTAAATVRVAFDDELNAGDGGELSFTGTLVRPAGNGTQMGSVVVTPGTDGTAGQASRVTVTGEFPVSIATTTQLAWARTSYLSGVTSGGVTPENTATVTAALTADPASTLSILWGGADPSAKPAAGTVGMLTSLTGLAVTTWPARAATVTVSGWTWDGGVGAPQKVTLVTDATEATVAGVLGAIDATTLRLLTGLRVDFAAASGQTIPAAQPAVLTVGVREYASVDSVPQTRTGAAADYRTDVATPPTNASSEINTLVVSGTVASVASRGTTTSTVVPDTESFRVYDPRPYAGSATTLAPAQGTTVYGGGFVKATAQATNWTRRAVEELGVTVRPTQADIDANDPVLNPDIADLDARVLPGASATGQQLAFAGFGAARTGDAGDGSGLVVGDGVTAGAGLTLRITVTSDVTTTPVDVDLSSTLGATLPTDPTLFGAGLTSWAQVTGFTASLVGGAGAAAVPMGGTVTVPYLVRAATSSTAATYTDHTLAFAKLGTDTSDVKPRSQASGNRPVTAATIAVAVPTVAVAGEKQVVDTYVATPAGRTATAVLSVQSRVGGSGHLPSTLVISEQRSGTGDGWWNVYEPAAVDTGAVAGVTTTLEYYTDTSSNPTWVPFLGTLSDLDAPSASADPSTWLGFRLRSTRDDGTDFPDQTWLRSRVTFAVRDAVLNGQAWTEGTGLTNTATFTGQKIVEGFPVTATATATDTVTAIAPDSAGGPVALDKHVTSSTREGRGQAVTANLTWGTDVRTDSGSVTVTDANGLGDGDDVPATGRTASYWDAFDLTSISAITSGPAAAGGVWDPYLVFDQVSDVRVYDATAGAEGWHSLRDQKWNGTAWVAATAGRTDVTFGGSTTAAFPYASAFPGVTIADASLRARIGGVQLVYTPLPTAARATVATQLAAGGDWRTALVSAVADGRVAATDGPARAIRLNLVLRDTSRADGTPVNDAHAYTTAGTAGTVLNSGRVTAVDGGSASHDLGGPANPPGQATTTITPSTLGASITKTWTRDSNSSPLQGSGAELQQVALPVGYDGSTPPAASAWPTATLTVTAATASATTSARVDQLVLSEPSDAGGTGWFDETSPFASFAITDVQALDTVAGVPGATGAAVTLYRWDGSAVQTSGTTVAWLLGASETDLADVVGLTVTYTGRIAPGADTRLVVTTRLLPENRVSDEQPGSGYAVENTARAAVQDARVCATETPAPIAATACAVPKVVAVTDDATLTVVAPSVTAFGALALGQTDLVRDAATPAVTSTMSVQNFGVSPADELLVTDADPRFFNAVRVDRVTVPQFPSGVDSARLEVLVRQPGVLDLAVDGTSLGYSDADPSWVAWGTDVAAGGVWDLAALAQAAGVTSADVIGVRVRFRDTDGSLIPAPGQSFGTAVLSGVLRETLLTGGLPSAVGADGWTFEGAPELTTNPGETARGVVHNSVTAQAVRSGLASSPQERYTEYLTVRAGTATVQVQKAELAAGPRKPGDHVRYQITVTNAATATADLTGLVVTDRLPEDGSLEFGTTPGSDAPVVVQGTDLGAWTQEVTDSTITVTFGPESRLAPGQSVQVLVWLRVADSLSSTTVVNSATAASTSRPVEPNPASTGGGTGCAAGTTYDAGAATCAVSAGALTIGGANVYISEKWVHDSGSDGALGAERTTGSGACTPRGTGADATWYRYPCAAVTEAGSTTQWQVQVTSRATLATSTLEMVDMLPAAGDHSAMQASGSRGSTWRPVWDGAVPTLVTATGTRVNATIAVYTTTAAYRAGGLAASSAFDPVPSTWTLLTPGQPVPAAQAARVTGFKFVLTFPGGDTFSQGESVRVGWSMRTPVSGVAAGTDAWNSFAFRVPADTGVGRLVDVTSVPLKAGVRYRAAAASADLVALGDRVWLDTDRDGVQDDGEPGIPGVEVDVLQGSGASAVYMGSATTDADGDWLLDGLPAGTYQVRLTLTQRQKDLYRFTGRDAGGSDALDSDATADPDGLGGTLDVAVIGAGRPGTVTVASMPQAWQDAHPGLAATFVDPTHDAGLQWRPLAVGDRVWLDHDRDGVFSAGDTGVQGATVTLIGPGTTERATTTLADGTYRFDSLDPGEYRIRVTVPAPYAGGWVFTVPLVGDDRTVDSDVQSDGLSAPFTLAAGGSMVVPSTLTGNAWSGTLADWADPTRDAGLLELPVSVGDRVWVDTDGDGVQDDGEPGLPGVVLVLTDADGDPVVDASGAPVGPVTTDADGAYLFADLVPGTYTVTVDQDASAAALVPYRPTLAGAGSDRGADSSTGSATTAARVGGGSSDLTLDFGFQPLVALGDRVWLDVDRDGLQGADEPGLAGIGVEVFGADPATPVWTGTTDADGDWLTGALSPGSYGVRFTLTAAQAELYRFTGTRAGAADLDSDAEPDADGLTATIAAATVDAGSAADGTVPVAGQAAGWLSKNAALDVHYVNPTWDAGLQWRPVAVGDRVWFDQDRDGLQGADEPGAEHVVVRLLDADDAVVATTETDADGGYRFDGLDPGTYRVEFQLPDELAARWGFTTATDAFGGADDSNAYAVAGSTSQARTVPIELAPGDAGQVVGLLPAAAVWAGVDADYADPTWDAGLLELPVSVGDRVWVDTDGDGVQDDGEPGLPGVVLVLTDVDGNPVVDASGDPVGAVTTDEDGAYLFADLVPGTYAVSVDAEASAGALEPYRPTRAGAGGDPAADSSTGSVTTAARVDGGSSDLSLDFGYQPLLALGDRVWLDADRDGVQDVGERSFAGATVRVLDAGGTVVATRVTGADGAWLVDLLPAGEYTVEVELAPADAARYTWTLLRSAAAPRADADSDVDGTGTPGLGRTGVVTLGPGSPGLRATTAADGLVARYVDRTWDAGLVERPVSVGHVVWFDEDGDGVQDEGEPGLPGVVLELRTPDGRTVVGADGTAVAPVTTDARGRYLFTGLLPGEYVVRIDRIASARALAGYTPTIAGAGADRAVDSSTWTSPSRALVGGEEDTTLDFGMVLADDVQLALRKTPVSRTADTITWDVTVASTGTQDAYAGFAVVDALPGALSFRSAEGDGFACTAVQQVVTCDYDASLPAGESATVRIVTGLTAVGADVTNTATVTGDGRGYRFEVLGADDVAWSAPAPAAADLATTGASPAGPLALVAAFLALGAVLTGVSRLRVLRALRVTGPGAGAGLGAGTGGSAPRHRG